MIFPPLNKVMEEMVHFFLFFYGYAIFGEKFPKSKRKIQIDLFKFSMIEKGSGFRGSALRGLSRSLSRANSLLEKATAPLMSI